VEEVTPTPTLPANARAAQIADLIEETYGCPREWLERLAAEVAGRVVIAVEDVADSRSGCDWLDR
jgi:hypothetical protein